MYLCRLTGDLDFFLLSLRSKISGESIYYVIANIYSKYYVIVFINDIIKKQTMLNQFSLVIGSMFNKDAFLLICDIFYESDPLT